MSLMPSLTASADAAAAVAPRPPKGPDPPPGSRTVRGRVFAEGEDGGRRYLEGVTVAVGYSEDLSTICTTITAMAVTGTDGTFLFEGLREDDRDLFLESDDWYVVERRELAPGEVELLAAPTGDLEGTVVGPDGEPRAGVCVRGGRGGAVFTDAEGRFRLRCVPGDAWITATYEVLRYTERHGEPGMVIRMEPTRAIPGRLVDAAGRGMGGARLRARCRDGLLRRGARPFPDGRFRLPELRGDVYDLEIEARGFATRRIEAVAAGTDAGRIGLSPE